MQNKLSNKIFDFLKRPKLMKRFFYKIKNIFYIFYRFKYRNLILRKNTSDVFVFKDIFINKELDIKIKNPKIIIDCGAYVGYSTFYFATKYPNAKIIALEPEKSNFEILKKNTEVLKNVILLNEAIYDKKTRLNISNKEDAKWAFKVKEDIEGEIKATTIEDLMKRFNFNKIDILKVDIEGAEKKLFKNSGNWIDKINHIIIELHDSITEECSESFFKAIDGKNFKTKINGEKVIATNNLKL